MKIPNMLRGFLREFGVGQVIALVVVILCIVVGVALGWDWLRRGGGAESNGETLRNVILAVGAVVALVLAVWRSCVAERQAGTAQRQAAAAQQQVDMAQQQAAGAQQQAAAAQQQADAARRGLTRERFQKGVEMIGSPVLYVRLGGIYALGDLAKRYPRGYHVQVMHVLCAFVRNPPLHDPDAPQPDVQEAVSVIGGRTEYQIQREQASDYRPDLSHTRNLRGLKMGWMNFSACNFEGADLSGAALIGSNLSGARLYEAILRGATLDGADLENANLTRADLTGVKSAVSTNFTNAPLRSADLSYANLQGAEFRHAALDGADLTGTVFIEGGLEAKGLTQKQIDSAKPLANDPTIPTVSSLVDPDTEQVIRWKKSR